ncbi:HTH domain-containing protein [Clostridium perfringens]|nr:HTH domain-containing protein [Clostridium perfringens]
MRILEILFFLLKSNCKVTIKELATMFGVSAKTIQRDLDKLSILGIPIITYRGVNGGIKLDNNYIIAKYILTKSDYKNLILSLYISENIIEKLKKADLIEKFKLVDNKKCTEILEEIKNRFIIDLEKDDLETKDSKYAIIDQALDNRNFIIVDVNEATFEVFPISYVLKNEGLYLYCYDSEYKLILINNISNISQSKKLYNKPTIKYEENKENIKVII